MGDGKGDRDMSATIDDFRPITNCLCPPIGTLVQVRPCAERYGKKTYIGIFVGDATIGFYKDGDKLEPWRNPMILIPDTQSIVYGCESWWGEITSIEELRQITDDDIQNVWYVKLLKSRILEKDNKKD